MFSNNSNINVIKTYVESKELLNLDLIKDTNLDDLNEIHFDTRHNIEHDFFSDIINNIPDKSNSEYIDKGDINTEKIVDEIYNLKPDLIITYGCSIIKPKLINLFHNKILNVHLGLSPYYFGSGTNFHALVNNEIYFFGYTFMYIDEGIDTGEIIHQARPDIFPFDNPHQIGNRLIKKMVNDFIKLVENFKSIEKIKSSNNYIGKTYKRKDATIELTEKLYNNFKNNSVLEYLKSKDLFQKKYKLIEQDFLK
jgi:folate-dependent phosphoribosylglycinamide formyltransferase PurN